jgi:hypothetical protein
VESSEQIRSLVSETVKNIALVEEETGGYVLVSAPSSNDAAVFGELLSQTLENPEDPNMPSFIPVPFDLLEYEQEEDPEPIMLTEEDDEETKPESAMEVSLTPDERYHKMIKTLSQGEVLLVYGSERDISEGLRILDEAAPMAKEEARVITVLCTATMIAEMPDQAPAFWPRAERNVVIIPNLGLVPRVLDRYKDIADKLKPGSTLFEIVSDILNKLKFLNSNLEKVKKSLVGNPKFGKIINIINKYQPISQDCTFLLEDLIKTAKPLAQLTEENISSIEGMKTVDRAIKKAFKQLGEIHKPLKNAANVLQTLQPIVSIINKFAGRSDSDSNPIIELSDTVKNLSTQVLQLVLVSVEVGSVSSSKTLISRALISLSGKNWDWNSLTRQLGLDAVLVSKLIGAAKMKIRSDSTTNDEEVQYALMNALKVLGEDHLRVFLTYQANAIRMELGPAFRPIFDGIYVHNVYTEKVALHLIKKLRENKVTIEIDENLVKTASQMHDIGLTFLSEYVANFLASGENIPAKERHEYLSLLANSYPRTEKVHDDYTIAYKIIDFESEFFGSDHAYIGSEIAKKLDWLESDPITWIIKHHHHPAFLSYPEDDLQRRQPTNPSPVKQLDKKRMPVTLKTLYIIILANQIFEKFCLHKEVRKTAETLKDYQQSLESNPAIDKIFLRHTAPLRTVLGWQTVMEEVVTYQIKLIENCRKILPNAKKDFTQFVAGYV